MWTCALVSIALAAPTAAERQAMTLRLELPEGFTVIVEEPWVVVGDEPPELVRARVSSTVRWATERLEADWFSSRPDEVWTIWLFRDDASYRGNAKALFGDEPDTPYGYAAHDDLVMNISTGGGTLVHEMVHPYLDADFPDVPPWFNEGLASLFEQCTERDGHIVGLINWRLAGLQAAVAADRVPTLEALMAQDRAAFYDRDPGTNYAQSRYLLLWLQEEGLLLPYYRAFRAHRERDPTGYATFLEVAKVQDTAAFEKRWARWVSALAAP